jgi:hypothetical protein
MRKRQKNIRSGSVETNGVESRRNGYFFVFFLKFMELVMIFYSI